MADLLKKVVLYLTVDERAALERLAWTQRRDVPQQAAWLVMQAVRQWEAREEAPLELELDAVTLSEIVGIEGGES